MRRFGGTVMGVLAGLLSILSLTSMEVGGMPYDYGGYAPAPAGSYPNGRPAQWQTPGMLNHQHPTHEGEDHRGSSPGIPPYYDDHHSLDHRGSSPGIPLYYDDHHSAETQGMAQGYSPHTDHNLPYPPRVYGSRPRGLHISEGSYAAPVGSRRSFNPRSSEHRLSPGVRNRLFNPPSHYPESSEYNNPRPAFRPPPSRSPSPYHESSEYSNPRPAFRPPPSRSPSPYPPSPGNYPSPTFSAPPYTPSFFDLFSKGEY